MITSRVVDVFCPAKHGQRCAGDRHEPAQGHHKSSFADCKDIFVFDGFDDGVISIHTDATKCCNGRYKQCHTHHSINLKEKKDFENCYSVKHSSFFWTTCYICR